MYVRPTALNRWLEAFDIDENDWKNIFKVCYYAVRETKLQALQYKIIHRIIPCQKWLFTLKCSDSPICLYCQDTDTLLHYFVECHSVLNFWKQLESWWNRTSSLHMLCTPKHIIFGVYYELKAYSTLNYTILLAKSYIYNCKMNRKSILFLTFLQILKRELEKEEYICSNNTDSLQKFHKKWDGIYLNL